MRANDYKLLLGAVFACLILLAVSVTAHAAGSEPWMYDDIVEVDFVISQVRVPMPDEVMIVDARPYKVKYVKGHIPGAVSIPFSEFDRKKDLLPKDKNALVIFYCGGLKCKLSHKSAKKAQALGYTNVKVFAKGFPEWKKQPGAYASVTAEYVAGKIAENKSIIVDARPLETKFNKGHIPTAISIPFSRFDELKGKLPRDLSTPIIYYCGGLKCRLSHKSAARAIAMGYKDVSVFSTGYPAWKKQYGQAGDSVAVKAGEVEGSIDLDRFVSILENSPESILLIDARDADEFAKGHFKTAVNIPVEKLEAKIKDLPADKPVVFVCSTGARSGEAYYMVKDLRESLEEVYYVEAEIDFKKDNTYSIKKPQ
ncbi:rhodanese-like domain-containing protein [Desulfospira joergensenii]|uniref:rhodanese-like domain-containing protein n=1 Tax=Desulfospira joergensenii TaxID=53329 RepID=UPI0003B5BA03|nr:rhodanese-like domain-containing protein [Desulfospira joergensenii]